MTEKDPFELMKKAFLIGLGATAVTMDKAQELADELVKRGEMTQKDAKGFTEDLKERAVKEKEQFETKMREQMDEYMKKAASKFGFVTREEFDELKAKVDAHGTSHCHTDKPDLEPVTES